MINVSDKLNQRAARWLREERNRQGKTQEELGDDSGVGQSAVSKAERLGPREIGEGRFLLIARALGVVSQSIEELPIADD
jgi:transcriptional regulator with XRE-family HTH domain